MTIKLPKVWQTLLALTEIPHDAPKGRDTKLVDPIPYRDDCREVEVRDGTQGILAKLCSGQTNYWLEWEILSDGEWHHFDEVDYELKEGTQDFYPCGSKGVETVQFEVVLV